MADLKITKRVVDAAEPRATRYTIFDRDVRGFGLRVFPSGAKSFVFEYRPGAGGRTAPKQRVTIGRAGDITPDEARRHAEALRARVSLGDDPQAAKAAARKAITVKDLAERFLAEHAEAKRRESTHESYEIVLRRHVLPKLGSRKAETVTHADIAALHLSMKSTPYQANRTVAVVGSMYAFANRQSLVAGDMNPARRIEKFREERRERFLTLEEIERLGTVLVIAETEGIEWVEPSGPRNRHRPKTASRTVIAAPAIAAIRLLLFTGARLREILDLKWSDVDLARRLLLLPASKTGRKTIYLGSDAVAVLASLEHLGPYVIPGDHPNRQRSDLKRPWAAISRAAGLEDVRLHDLRHTFASYGAGGGLGLPVIGKLLGHSQPATTARYAHLDASPLHSAADRIGREIGAALGRKGRGTIGLNEPE
jgi:integrase